MPQETTFKTFFRDKSQALHKDKSFKSSWDKPLVPLMDLMNAHPCLYTTSSCSGRLSLMSYESSDQMKKYDAKFLYVNHELVKENEKDEIWNHVLTAAKKQEEVWLQSEPVILHFRVFKKDLIPVLMQMFKECAYKNTGIMSLKKQIISCAAVECIKTILVHDGKVMITREYFDLLIDEANKRLNMSHEKINRVFERIQKYFWTSMCAEGEKLDFNEFDRFRDEYLLDLGYIFEGNSFLENDNDRKEYENLLLKILHHLKQQRKPEKLCPYLKTKDIDALIQQLS